MHISAIPTPMTHKWTPSQSILPRLPSIDNGTHDIKKILLNYRVKILHSEIEPTNIIIKIYRFFRKSEGDEILTINKKAFKAKNDRYEILRTAEYTSLYLIRNLTLEELEVESVENKVHKYV